MGPEEIGMSGCSDVASSDLKFQEKYGAIIRGEIPHGRGEAQQTQLAMSLVLHRIRGIGSPRDFIRFLRCQFGRILNRPGFEGMFPQGRGGATADARSLSWAVRPFHRFTKSHGRY